MPNTESDSAVNRIRTFLQVGNGAPKHTRSFSYHSSFDVNQAERKQPKITIRQLKKMQKKFNKETQELYEEETDEEMIFDLENAEPSMANALRRIMISEVPSVAIHYVVVNRNTSILKDEILAHRLGLVPINADPDQFRFKEDTSKSLLERQSAPNKIVHNPELPEELSDNETVLFQLKVKCQRVNGKVINSHVYSKDLKWIPFGNQKETFKSDPIRPVHSDILIAKLAPGQEIDLDLYCQKGTGLMHAKFSPVSTATYKLLPHIEFPEEIRGDEAKKLVKKCPMDVFDIEDDTAVVANPRNCTMCRECIREDGWEDKVNLFRKKDHFIFTVESTGIMPPKKIFKHALKVLYTKAYNQLREVQEAEKRENAPEETSTFK